MPNCIDKKLPITAAGVLNDQDLPVFAQHATPLNRVLTDLGTEYCGVPECHEYERYLAVQSLDHTRAEWKACLV